MHRKDFLHIYEYRALKPVKVIFRRGKGDNGGNEPNLGTLYTYMEMSQ
jgi:hypothetical protein